MVSIPLPPDGDMNRAGEVYAFTWIFAISSIIFVIARMYSRTKLTKNVWWDDWCICIALVRFGLSTKGFIAEINDSCS